MEKGQTTERQTNKHRKRDRTETDQKKSRQVKESTEKYMTI